MLKKILPSGQKKVPAGTVSSLIKCLESFLDEVSVYIPKG